jgi:RNA polymerase II-associated factor 1
MRYARPEFLNNLAINTPLPMIVDAECGMPLDLGKWECLWEEDADDSGEFFSILFSNTFPYVLALEALNPDPDSLPIIDSKDLFLLGDPSTSALYSNGVLSATSSVPSTPAPVQVPWLRKTEYISREGVQRISSHEPYVFTYSQCCPSHGRSTTRNRKYTISDTIDVSPSAQIRDIEASFAACNDAFSISSIHHPNKPKVTAVDSYEIFPDVDIWANAYDLFRFSERPGERSIDVRT